MGGKISLQVLAIGTVGSIEASTDLPFELLTPVVDHRKSKNNSFVALLPLTTTIPDRVSNSANRHLTYRRGIEPVTSSGLLGNAR